MKLLIVGYGKMGRMVEELAGEQGFDIAGRVDEGRPEWAPADVAIDFSTAEALLGNFNQYATRRPIRLNSMPARITPVSSGR